MTPPHITLWKKDLSTDYPEIKQGRFKRNFLDQTHNSHGYHCQPMTTAHVSGWEFILPQDVTVIWNGVYSTSETNIKILDGEYYNGVKIVRTDTGNGLITFNLNVIIETDKDHHSILKGPPNYFFEGADPVEVVIRSDYFNVIDNFFCWRMNAIDKPVTFKKGMPIAFLINYPNNLLESTNIKINKIEEDGLKDKENREYSEMRKDFQKNAKDWEWTNFYKKGKLSADKKIDVKIKPNLMEP